MLQTQINNKSLVKRIAPRPYDLGAISSFTANTFLTTKRVRICVFW